MSATGPPNLRRDFSATTAEWRSDSGQTFQHPHTSVTVYLACSGSSRRSIRKTTKFAQMLDDEHAWERQPSVRDTDIAFPQDKSFGVGSVGGGR